MNYSKYHGKRVRISKDKISYEGILIPSEFNYNILKLDNGYNIGISKEYSITLIDQENLIDKKEQPIKENHNINSDIHLLHTGGTIASKIDYKTGAVLSGFSPDDIVRKYPELQNINTKFVTNIQSEMMNFNHYNIIADSIDESISNGAKGIIITHGTDTLHYTSAALSFMFQNIPIILVGSQRSSDRPSTDARLNLKGALIFLNEAIKLGISGVYISSHLSTNDDDIVILKGLNARKMHTSRRDTFKQINSKPFAIVKENKITFLNSAKKYEQNKTRFNPNIKVGFLKSHPNMFKEEILTYKDYDGLIIEGTGLGHIPSDEVDEYTKENKAIFDSIKYLISRGVIVAIVSQTIYGRINLNVYSPQRRLKSLGILGHMCDMSPETAYIKLSWLLSNYSKEEVKKLYEKNIVGEISENLHFDGYM